MKNKKQIFDLLVQEIGFEIECELIEKQKEVTALKEYVMTKLDILPTSKLYLVYLIENNLEEFNSTAVYRKLGYSKPHFLRYVKPELVNIGFIKETGRFNCLFMNPLKVIF
jgi:hypothetical protein